jgi:hypothetical protein
MATYKEIKGTNIEILSSDPSYPISGQVWYNSTSNVLKGQGATTTGSWSTGGNLNTARNGNAGAGTQTASIVFGGRTPPNNYVGNTEFYDGSSWTEVNDLNTGRYDLGSATAGTQTASLAFGGGTSGPDNYYALCESFNGTNWTEVNDLTTGNPGRVGLAGAGTQTAALAFGGYRHDGSGHRLADTETWNGTNWTEVNNLNQLRTSLGGCGATNTAALAFGGYDTTQRAYTELWNGTNWTAVNALNTARETQGSIGISTSALCVGGYSTTFVGITEEWNGTNWTEVADLATARAYGIAGAGSTTSGLVAGGQTAPGATNVSALTEEWLGAGSPTTVTFTDS